MESGALPIDDSRHEIGHRHFERSGKFVDVHDGNVPFAAFDAADVIAVQSGEISDFLLGKPFFEPNRSQSLAKTSHHVGQVRFQI